MHKNDVVGMEAANHYAHSVLKGIVGQPISKAMQWGRGFGEFRTSALMSVNGDAYLFGSTVW
jgi:hypothetical protein